MESIKRYLPAIITALIILVFTTIPGKAVSSAGLDKESYQLNGHFIMYLVLSFTSFKALKNIRIACLSSLLYGILMEFLQKLIPGRAFQLLDIIVNGSGSFLAFLILWKRSLILPKKLLNWLER